MFTIESMALEEAYDNLISNVSLGNIYAFLKACWLIGDSQTFSSTTLEKMVYAEGDQQEVYTRRERQIIKFVSNSLYSHSFQLESSSGNIDCRLIVIVLASDSNVIYDCIATMKILTKAIDGFNIFMFVTTTGVHFGCSSLTAHDTFEDCILAYAINGKTNWDQLADAFLYRNDSQRVYEYYFGLLNLFDSIKYCQAEQNKNNTKWELVNYEEVYDNNFLEDTASFNIDNYYSEYSDQSYSQTSMDVYRFEQEVVSCMSELSEIKKTHINPLEMLFEAEKALFVSEQEAADEPTTSTVESDEDLHDLALLDDPIALMKKLKKNRGI